MAWIVRLNLRHWRARKATTVGGMPGLPSQSTSLATAVSLAIALAAIGMLLVALAVDWYVHRNSGQLQPADRAGVALDVLKVSGAVVAGLGAAVALTVSYRRQREEEGRRDGERFEQAAQQLGDSDPAVRIAGVYALARLANESDEYSRSIVQLLCAYLRLNRPDDTPIQQTICEVLVENLASEAGPGPWTKFPIDLHGVVFEEEVNFSACAFGARARFDDAVFLRGANFVYTRFGSQTLFNNSEFKGSAYFFFSDFHGTALFNNVKFEGMTAFSNVQFMRGLQANHAVFAQGSGFREAKFPNGANFSHAEMGHADFGSSVFARGVGRDQSDAVHRGAAYFRSATFSHARFDGAIFRASVHFDDAKLMDGTFDGVIFTDEVTVLNADFGAVPSPPAAQSSGANPAENPTI